MERLPHEIRADVTRAEPTRLPHGLLDGFEGLKYGGVVVAADKVPPCARGQ